MVECQQRLDVIAFDDYCPNGLQVEGKGEVRRLVTGVTASLALAQAAVEESIDSAQAGPFRRPPRDPDPCRGRAGRGSKWRRGWDSNPRKACTFT